MALFGKKKESKTDCCGGNCNTEAAQDAKKAVADGSSIQILGGGCKKCNDLEANTNAALSQMGIDLPVGHITDFAQIAALGVMTTPALMINGKVMCYGKVASVEEVKKLIIRAGITQ